MKGTCDGTMRRRRRPELHFEVRFVPARDGVPPGISTPTGPWTRRNGIPARRGKGDANAAGGGRQGKEPSTAWDPLLPDDGGIAPHNPAPQHKAVALGVLVYLR